MLHQAGRNTSCNPSRVSFSPFPYLQYSITQSIMVFAFSTCLVNPQVRHSFGSAWEQISAVVNNPRLGLRVFHRGNGEISTFVPDLANGLRLSFCTAVTSYLVNRCAPYRGSKTTNIADKAQPPGRFQDRSS